ncbi:MAG: 7-cyano-7-deazaguanine synthase QueC [Proteobacteria bacterium]|nr:7-cyano-7-deazaguanine synthase QueC [Pseudomonadota bacterium]MDA1299876.1 7-cyano-7-deazaguanine synthase QueC [Pseudomonadota bacterium]
MSEADRAPVDKAVVLLSGGLDSATTLALARDQGYDCYCLSFDYGQRHAAELDFARRVANTLGAQQHRVAMIDIGAFGGSALTDPDIPVPDHGQSPEGIPVTYVPARNTIFLSYALGWAEVLGARDIFVGVNAVDYSGYPDCRPEFIAAFETLANLATRSGVTGDRVRIHAPLMALGKGEIITRGIALGVDYGITVSCYRLDSSGAACGRCDACVLRRKGFDDAAVSDPTRYVE